MCGHDLFCFLIAHPTRDAEMIEGEPPYLDKKIPEGPVFDRYERYTNDCQSGELVTNVSRLPLQDA
jgi:hypothetical protein